MTKASSFGNLKGKNTILIYNQEKKAVHITSFQLITGILHQSTIATYFQQAKQQTKHLENNRQNH